MLTVGLLLLAGQLVQSSTHSPSFPFSIPVTRRPAATPSLPDLTGFLVPRGEGVSVECIEAGDSYITGLNTGVGWAYKMFDASGKLPKPGLTQGNFLPLPGSFDSCLEIDTLDFTGKYCMLSTVASKTAIVKPKRFGEDKINPVLEQYILHNSPRMALGLPPELVNLLGNFGVLLKGQCIPSSCSHTDAEIGWANFVTGASNRTLDGYLVACHTTNDVIDMTSGDWALTAVLIVLGLIILTGTLIDVSLNLLHIEIVPEKLVAVFQGFSIYQNTVKLFTVTPNRENLGCINGIRFLSMSWVIIGHTYLAATQFLMKSNPLLLQTWSQRDGMSTITNALVSVDSFFLIGAVLLTYLTLKELDAKKGGSPLFWIMFYVHRYIRLTGVYAFIIALNATYLKFLSTGPQSFLIDATVRPCQENWWLNLLYINNFSADLDVEQCIGWTWYMANDMQMFLISPIIIYLFWRWPKVGSVFSGVLLTTTTALLYWIRTEQVDGNVPDDFNTIYIKPWYRFQPYIMGMMLGMVLHTFKNKPSPRMNLKVGVLVTAGWSLAFLSSTLSLYGRAWSNLDARIAETWETDDFPKGEHVFFEAFHKIGWSLGLGWVILACAKGFGGPVNTLLSWPFWVPLARLSYCCYLVHFTVIFITASFPSYTIELSHSLIGYLSIGNTAVSLLVAFIMVLLFEAPLLHAERLLFSFMGLAKLPPVKRKLA